MAKFDPKFTALLGEAQFTKELLGAGATEIRRANYAKKGLYFQSFSSLSTGLERIGKLCLMLDHYLENKGVFPDFKHLKNEIGHDINLLQEKAEKIVERCNFSIQTPASPIHKEIITLLSNFAKGDRYSNINLLVNSKQQTDPIAEWYIRVDTPLYEKHVSERKKRKINEDALMAERLTGKFTAIWHSSETGSELTSVEQASKMTGIYEAVAPYRQLYVLQIIRFWVKLLCELQCPAQAIGKKEIPYFNEIFGAFGNNDAYIKTRKTWDKI